MPHDNVVDFLQHEYRAGFLLADPDQVCTVAFLEHLAQFIEAQCRCLVCATVAADYAREVENLQRRGGRA
jgi:hypothetical protein